MVVCFSVYVLEHTGMGVPHFLCHGKTGSIPHNPELDKWGEKTDGWMAIPRRSHFISVMTGILPRAAQISRS